MKKTVIWEDIPLWHILVFLNKRLYQARRGSGAGSSFLARTLSGGATTIGTGGLGCDLLPYNARDSPVLGVTVHTKCWWCPHQETERQDEQKSMKQYSGTTDAFWAFVRRMVYKV